MNLREITVKFMPNDTHTKANREMHVLLKNGAFLYGNSIPSLNIRFPTNYLGALFKKSIVRQIAMTLFASAIVPSCAQSIAC